jgi:hypothetical protein
MKKKVIVKQKKLKLAMGPTAGPTPRRTGRLTIGRNIT